MVLWHLSWGFVKVVSLNLCPRGMISDLQVGGMVMCPCVHSPSVSLWQDEGEVFIQRYVWLGCILGAKLRLSTGCRSLLLSIYQLNEPQELGPHFLQMWGICRPPHLSPGRLYVSQH